MAGCQGAAGSGGVPGDGGIRRGARGDFAGSWHHAAGATGGGDAGRGRGVGAGGGGVHAALRAGRLAARPVKRAAGRAVCWPLMFYYADQWVLRYVGRSSRRRLGAGRARPSLVRVAGCECRAFGNRGKWGSLSEATPPTGAVSFPLKRGCLRPRMEQGAGETGWPLQRSDCRRLGVKQCRLGVKQCRLGVKQCRLGVKQCRLGVEQCRLGVKQCRLGVEQCRLGVE